MNVFIFRSTEDDVMLTQAGMDAKAYLQLLAAAHAAIRSNSTIMGCACPRCQLLRELLQEQSRLFQGCVDVGQMEHRTGLQ